MAVRNPISAQRQVLARVSGIAGSWATKSGGEIAAETSKVWDGGKRQPEVLASPSETSNLILSRPYRPGLHQYYRRNLSDEVGQWRATVYVQDVDANGQTIGTPVTYPDALLVRMTAPDGDASSGDAAVWEMEFAVSGAA